MKNKLVVVTDLGSFKAFRVEESEFNSTPRLEKIQEFDTVTGHERIQDITTDAAGRFPRGTATSEMSAGERHNIELEQRRRLVKQLASTIGDLIRQDHFEDCYVAASKEIHKQLLDELPSEVRSKITKDIASNLTKVDKNDLLKHF